MDLEPLTENTVSSRLANFVERLDYNDLSALVIESAKSRILDAVATAIAAHDLAVPRTALRFVAHHGGNCSVVGEANRFSPIDASFVNAVLINGTTHDDFLEKSHAGAAALPAALAAAEDCGGSGRALLTSVVLGYDLTARAYLGGPGMLPRFRASGVASAIGAAASAAYGYGLSAEATAHALGCAAMFASGFGEGFRSGTMDVKLNVGWAVRSGVSAALLARAGATSAPRVFEGESGFFNAFANTAKDADATTRELGTRFLIEDAVYKERPVCIFVQTPVQLACDFAAERVVAPEQIERVVIRAPLATYTNPGYTNVAPFQTPLQARISVRFCVASALLGLAVSEYKYYENFNDPSVLALAEKIELVDPRSVAEPSSVDRLNDDTDVKNGLPRQDSSPNHVTLEIVAAGHCYRRSAGEMDMLRPTLTKLIDKYSRLTQHLPGQSAERLLDVILHLEHEPDMRHFGTALREAVVDKRQAQA